MLPISRGASWRPSPPPIAASRSQDARSPATPRDPRAASASALEKNSILLAVTAAGQVVYGGRELGLGGVRPLVKRLTQQDPMPVIIQVDEKAAAGLALKVLDESKLGGALNVSFAAARP